MNTKFFATCLGLIVIFGAQNAWAKMELVNTQFIALEGISAIEVEYIADTVEIIPSAGQELVLREYMDDDKGSYLANVRRSGSTLSIAAGERPWLWSFDCRAVLELPMNYLGALSLSTTSGKITTRGPLALARLHTKSVSGSIVLDTLTVTSLTTENTSGKLTLLNVIAQMDLRTVSGAVALDNCRGPLFIESVSGKIEVALDQLLGSLTLNSTSGKIDLRIPADSGYELLADTVSGRIRLNLDALTEEYGRQVRAATERQPRQSIRLRTISGAISARH